MDVECSQKIGEKTDRKKEKIHSSEAIHNSLDTKTFTKAQKRNEGQKIQDVLNLLLWLHTAVKRLNETTKQK